MKFMKLGDPELVHTVTVTIITHHQLMGVRGDGDSSFLCYFVKNYH